MARARGQRGSIRSLTAGRHRAHYPRPDTRRLTAAFATKNKQADGCSSGSGGSRVVGFGSLRRTLLLLERPAPAQGVAGVLARCQCRRQRVSGHVVFLGGHDATHQDERSRS